jgi:hypothetical protein
MRMTGTQNHRTPLEYAYHIVSVNPTGPQLSNECGFTISNRTHYSFTDQVPFHEDIPSFKSQHLLLFEAQGNPTA